MTYTTALLIVDAILFTFTTISVAYLFVFALASIRKKTKTYPEAIKQFRFAVFFPAYKEDNVIVSSVLSALDQTYPKELFDIIVISDRMQDETNKKLSELPIILLKVNFENSSKAKALNFAMSKLKDKSYEIAVILDGDNTVDKDYLYQLNKAYSGGSKAIQTHRVAKNLNTETAILDAVSEEINNSIFRKGHVNLGLSSALIGSGMAFNYPWFEHNMKSVTTTGEDKEIEAILLKQHISVAYLDNVFVYDEKVQKEEVFKHQRRRWLAAQYGSLNDMLHHLPEAIRQGNSDYCNKVFQLIMFSRIINIGIIIFIAFVLLFTAPILSIKWFALLIVLILSLFLATPTYLINKQFFKAIRRVPVLCVIMLVNLFRLRGVNKKFIHTDHGTVHK